MLIDSVGLLYGERRGACSNEAQLHFSRLLVASNCFARIEMNYSKLISIVYGGMNVKPTKEQVPGWFTKSANNIYIAIRHSSISGMTH